MLSAYRKEKLITFKSGSRLYGIESDDSDYDYTEVYNDNGIDWVSPFRVMGGVERREYVDNNKHYDITQMGIISFLTQIKKQNPNFMLGLLSSPHSVETGGLRFLTNKSRLFDTEIAYKSFMGSCKGIRKEIDKLTDSGGQGKAIGKLYCHYITTLMGLNAILAGKLEIFPLKKDTDEFNILFQAKYHYNEHYQEILDEYIQKYERAITLKMQDGTAKLYKVDSAFIEHYLRSKVFYQ